MRVLYTLVSLTILIISFQNCSNFEANINQDSSSQLTSSTPPADTPRQIVINNSQTTLDGSSHTFTISDSNATDDLTKYSIWIGDKNYSTSVVAPGTSIVANGLPTDGKQYEVTLRPPEGYTKDNFKPVTALFTAAIARRVQLLNGGTELSGSTHTFYFKDSQAIDGVTRYDIWIGDKDYSTSVVAPAKSIIVNNLPTDGKKLSITLRPPAGYEEDNFEYTEAEFTAAQVSGDIYPINFGAIAKPFGSLSDTDLSNWTSGFRSARKKEHLSVVIEDGKGVLRHRYKPSSTGSERVVFRYDIPHHRTYRLKYSVYFEPGFKWGQRYQGGKLAFGFGGGAAPSGGQVNSAGFTARVMWRGNYLGGGKYDGTGRFVMYTYNADRDLSKSTVGLDTQFGDYQIPLGKWIDIVFEIKMNSATHLSDGSMQAWVDGKQLVNKQQIQWWSSGSKPRIDRLYYSSFYGGSNPQWAPPHDTYVKVRDVAYAPVIDGESAIQP